jgi:ABC-type glycerol-3-phosphate transport system substrate-binding protein
MNKQKHLTSLIMAGLVALALLVAACAQPTPQVIEKPVVVEKEVPVTIEVEKVVTAIPAPPGPVTISFWHIYSEAEMNMLEQTLIPRFEAAHPNVTVESVQIPYQEFRRKLLTSIAGGSAPDLIRSDIIGYLSSPTWELWSLWMNSCRTSIRTRKPFSPAPSPRTT